MGIIKNLKILRFQIKFIVLTNKGLRIRGEKVSMPLINNIKTVVSIFDIEKIKKLRFEFVLLKFKAEKIISLRLTSICP